MDKDAQKLENWPKCQCTLKGEKRKLCLSPNQPWQQMRLRDVTINGTNFRNKMYLSSSSAANMSELVGSTLEASLDLC